MNLVNEKPAIIGILRSFAIITGLGVRFSVSVAVNVRVCSEQVASAHWGAFGSEAVAACLRLLVLSRGY